MICISFTLAFSNCEPVKYAESQNSQDKEVLRARVVGISDGDSMVVLVDGNKQERVRLATIDAPENHQNFGKPSKQSLSGLIYKKDVRIVYGFGTHQSLS